MSVALFTGRPGVAEILVILLVIVIFFGAKRIPEIARSLGRSLNEFKKGREEGARDDVEDEPKKDEPKA